MHIYHNHADPCSPAGQVLRRVLALTLQGRKALLDTLGREFAEHVQVDWRSMLPDIPRRLFAQEQLEALAEEFKKNEFKLTLALADDLQDAAEKFIIQRHRDEVTLRLSEERKDYQAFCDLFAELTKRFRSWNDPWIRVHFAKRLLDPYFQEGKEVDEAFCEFAELAKRFRSWNNNKRSSKICYQIPDRYLQVDKKIKIGRQEPPIDLYLRYFVLEILVQAEQLSQAMHRLFKDVLHRIPQDRRGRRKDWPLHTFILKLKAIWEKGTAKKAGRSRNPRTREIEGPFVRFVTVCLTCLEPHKPYPSLGETIHKVLQAETVARNGKNSPKK